ncbi:serine hydrolase domain-containing protein [Demequina sp. SYSU T00039]|uniref:Serine hydrolase domain-containing protein n=1 Tax=Demequina lignilytica TaxID=3051663 RepID=A0AAW7M072_9MICO|nr:MULTISPECIES: serine hydrolase domain-containing protein [unclassified Demequina]MDN4477316.1 serine hydrolase domain-containing protein [Demequina sp. SYSU T00039-1]MDN4487489.1 serine hydrolase domain-containing protein [Demequina sp. SYSU T00039]MDN4491041.1 serine hydrolase domain-containing protein [Demequina sp. SYSU T00068]
MRHLIATAILALATVGGAGVPAAADTADSDTIGSTAIEDIVAAELPASLAPGVSYAVVRGGELAESGGQGVARKGTDTPVTADTPFLIGSISKSFTALAVMQLVEAGDVDLDAPGGDYVEALAGTPAGAPTVRELLSHTSGFSTLQGNTAHGDRSGGEDDLANAVSGLADVTPAYEPGTRWEYSNTNYQVLGRLIEEVIGTSYQAYVTEHILEPVGMTASTVADGAVHLEMATGHTPWFWTKRPLGETPTDRATAPQGGIIASAHDLSLYLGMMMNGEDDVLSAAGKAQMMRPASAVSPFYGFGWYVNGEGTVGHSGAVPGVETQATMAPGGNDAVVVLVNGGSGIGFGETTQLRYAVTAAALDLDYAGEGSRWGQKALFLGLALAPVLYLLAMAWAWAKRDKVRAKTSGAAGLFSLWFPVLTTAAAAWVLLWLVPGFMGAPLSTVRIFQPDMALIMTATAVGGVVWALFRIVIAYTGPRPANRLRSTV